MTQEVTIGEITYRIDQTVGSQSERDSMFQELQNLSQLSEMEKSHTGLDGNRNGLSTVTVSVSSDSSELEMHSSDGTSQGPMTSPGNILTEIDSSTGEMQHAHIYIDLDRIGKTEYQPADGSLSPVDMTAGAIFVNEAGSIIGYLNENYIPPGMKSNPVFDQGLVGGAEDIYSGHFEDIYHLAMGEPVRGAETPGQLLLNLMEHDPFATVQEWIEAILNDEQHEYIGLPVNVNTSERGIDITDSSGGADTLKIIQAMDDGNGTVNLYESSEASELVNAVDASADQSSPLVLDIDMDGIIELSAFSDTNTTFFDLDEDGFAERTGWVSADDGLLALDINNNGRIDDNAELFGSADESGFYQLSALDSNSDGVINASDDDFGKLLIWRDINQNGGSEFEELDSLNAYNITEISLSSTRIAGTNQGHFVSDEATFTVDNGITISTHIVQDIWFEHDNLVTKYIRDYTFDISSADLVTVRGYGEIADLHIAMSLDNGVGGLMEMNQTLVDTSFDDLISGVTLQSDIRDIMHRWAGVDGVSSTSRGNYVDAKDLEYLEKFTGQPFLQHGYEPNPMVQAGAMLTETFLEAQMAVGARLLLQSNGAELFSNSVEYTLATDTFTDPGALDSAALSDIETLASAPGADAMAIWENVVFLVVGARGGVNNVTGADITALDTAISNTISGTYYSDVLNSLYGIDDNGLDITGTSSADTIDGAGFEDLLQGQDGDDTINGYNGNDYIATGGGNDTAYGGNGHDEIYNYSGNDTFYGGSGADLITSGTGSDTYVFNVGDGDDTIVESYSTSATDRIQFGSGITLSDLTFTRVSNEDLLITIDPSAGGGSILVDGHFKSYAENINEIVFSDTSTFDPESINYTLHATDNAETQLNGVHTGSDDDTIYGHGGNDRIFGYQGADNLYGGDGDDTIYAYNTSGEYADTHAHILDGGAGNDLIRAADGADDITGGTGNDSLFGYSGNDTYTFNYGDGNDTLEDDAGTADVIELGAGITQADLSYDLSEQYDLKIIIDGGAGGSIFINRMYYSATYQVESLVLADSTVIDLIYQDYEWSGSNGNDYLYGRDFNDSVDTIHGLDGDDYIIGERGDDVLYGDAGDDEIYGDYGDDIIYGGTGADTLRGSYGADELYGGDGNDDIRSGADDDILSGGLGDDYLNGEGGYGDIVDYGTASNGVVVNFQTGTATGEGTDTLSSIEYAHGSSYNDTFSPSYYTKGFDGKGGVDTLDLAAGYGASYYANVNLASGTMSGYYINLTLANIENVIGRSGNDTLTGDAQANQLEGRNGNDTISGADGDDLLYGGSGNDTVTGGNGADTYFFLDGETGSDTITDFSIADGDALNLADMLSLFDPLTDILTDFVEITDSGSNSIVKIDQDGGADSFVQIATLTGVTGLTDEDALEASGNLIAA